MSLLSIIVLLAIAYGAFQFASIEDSSSTILTGAVWLVRLIIPAVILSFIVERRIGND